MFDVIVPTYKVSTEFLKPCLDSILNQNFTDWHCWIADGTPEDDATYQPMMDLIANYPADRFTYLRQSGRGVSQARNEAIAQGTQPFIATLDGDDLWYPEHLTWMVEAIESTTDDHVLWWAGADALIEMISMKTGNHYQHRGIIGWFEDYSKVRPEDLHFFLRGNPVIPSNTVCRRNRFETVGGYDEVLQIGEDTDLYTRMIAWGEPYRGHQVDSVSGYHGCGPHQTTQFGSQSSAAHGRNEDELKTEFQRQHAYWYQKHGENPECPEGVDPDYWFWLIDSVNNRFKDNLMFEIQA